MKSPAGAPRHGTAALRDLVDAANRCPGAHRLRGLPAPLGRRDLPVKPHRGRFHATTNRSAPSYDIDRLSEIVGCEVHDPNDLYQRSRTPRSRPWPTASASHSATNHPARPNNLRRHTMTEPLTHHPNLQRSSADALEACGVNRLTPSGGTHEARTPLTGEVLLTRRSTRRRTSTRCHRARPTRPSRRGATCPRPLRGNSGQALGRAADRTQGGPGALVTAEAGKIRSEALGEVQEMIDICDFAVGLSRQLYGKTMPSERPGHRLDGNLAPARRRRGHLCLQLPGRRLRPGIRRWLSCAATPSCGSPRG